ncbi:hypothetical protein W02_34200 [Nitrospira sp. KM1]|uniref:glycosyltransferase family 4 protein n=1 Tax=Nitrospira sp. KM1 TaxID=1936990 RepID=UPI0013A79C5C|nr:glycosyltransferase family 4 protein [Nitrospira sp. KM1]BCA56280.1 hypothetical protein W02_34200 [Nitrospira sp. KM1]
MTVMNRQRRIAWIHNGDAGGSKRFAYEMVRHLAARGYLIDEYIVRGRVSNEHYLSLRPFVRASVEVTIRRTDVSWLRPYLVSSLAALALTLRSRRHIDPTLTRLAQTINSKDYDYVHIDQYPFCLAIEILPRLTQPAVLYSHEPSISRYAGFSGGDETAEVRPMVSGLYPSICARLQRISSRLLDRQDIDRTRLARLILVNSHYSREIFFQRYGAHAKVCYYGVDCATFEPRPVPIEPIILSAGRIVRAKQHHLVIEAVASIKRPHRPHMVIATPECDEHLADSEYRDELARSAKNLDVDLRIRYRPGEHELSQLYRQALALVFVPIMEPFGLVALEAMACGTPVIGVKEAGIREFIIDGVTGMLIDREVPQIAAAIRTLQHHARLRSEMGRQGAEVVRAHWTWERAADRYEQMGRRALDI